MRDLIIFATALFALVSCADSLDSASPSTSVEDARPFSKSLSLQGISFQVSCPNQGPPSKLTIVPSGLAGDNSPVTEDSWSFVTGAEVADLNADGSPELYVYVNAAERGSHGDVIGYAVNNRKSLSRIRFPEILSTSDEARGYLGYDQFAVVENRLVRRFPICRGDDSNAQPSGKVRQIPYKMTNREAGWQLEPLEATDF